MLGGGQAPVARGCPCGGAIPFKRPLQSFVFRGRQTKQWPTNEVVADKRSDGRLTKSCVWRAGLHCLVGLLDGLRSPLGACGLGA